MSDILQESASDSALEHARSIMEESSVYLHINVAVVVLLCVLFGMWAPIIF